MDNGQGMKGGSKREWKKGEEVWEEREWTRSYDRKGQGGTNENRRLESDLKLPLAASNATLTSAEVIPFILCVNNKEILSSTAQIKNFDTKIICKYGVDRLLY